MRYNITPNPNLDDEAYVEQAKGMSDAQLRSAMIAYEAKQAFSRGWRAPHARRLVGARWWLKGGGSADLDRHDVRRNDPPEIWLGR